MKKIKWKRKIILLCIAAFVVMAAVQIVRINKKYPAPEEIRAGLNEEIAYNENIMLMVSEMEFLDESRVREIYRNEFEHNGDCKAVLLKLVIENKGDTEDVIDMSSFILQSGAWKNAMLLNVFGILNEEIVGSDKSTMNPTIAPGESISYILPFHMIPDFFTEKQWEEVEKQEYQLVVSLYPEKKVFHMRKDAL